jgi:c-di-AMP phosphodiesterase-like protein
MISICWRAILHAPSLYRQTVSYIASVIVLILVTMDKMRLDVGIVVLGIVAILIVLQSVNQRVQVVSDELDTVHTMVNSSHDEMLDRVDQLIEALSDAGVAIPPNPAAPRA